MYRMYSDTMDGRATSIADAVETSLYLEDKKAARPAAPSEGKKGIVGAMIGILRRDRWKRMVSNL